MTETPNRPKDLWDKLSVVLHPVGGLLTALAVTAVGVMGSQVLNRRQALDTNARLYSELMSRREESESSLRKDMFVSIIQTFLKPGAGDLDTKVLNLELLAYNFHESLNLKPLFMDIARRLEGPEVKDRLAFRARLNRIAREISAKQLFALEGHGKSFRRTVDLEEVRRQGRSGVALDSESIDIGGKGCNVNLYVLDSDAESQQLKMRLELAGGHDDREARVAGVHGAAEIERAPDDVEADERSAADRVQVGGELVGDRIERDAGIDGSALDVHLEHGPRPSVASLRGSGVTTALSLTEKARERPPLSAPLDVLTESAWRSEVSNRLWSGCRAQ